MKSFKQFLNENMDMVRAHMLAAARRRKMANHPRYKDDKGMKRMFNDDADRHQSIANSIRSGHHEAAKNSFWRMDTEARDEVYVGTAKKHAQKYYSSKDK